MEGAMARTKEPDQPEWVTCPFCGNEQSDMGSNVACEECDKGPMPSPSADRLADERARKRRRLSL
jgi:hypothetical protein